MKDETPRKPVSSARSAISLAKDYFKVQDNLLCPPIVRAAFSDRMAWILASMSHLAYDHYEDTRDAQKLRKIFITKLKSGGFELIKTFNDKGTDTQAFLAKNDQFAVLAFRGTEVSKFEDIKIDAAASKISVLDGRVHAGFRQAYESVAKDIEASLLKMDEELPLYITGHSLGAALATVATQRLEHNPRIRERIAACYTFGSPRVGNSHYDLEFKSPIYRVVNTTDIVTVIPLLAMGYIHIGDVRFLGAKEGEFQRGVPLFRRIYLFLLTVLKFFSPVVSDHAIVEYRRKLEAIAEKRNPRFGH
jgi:triacylglycerol lipase